MNRGLICVFFVFHSEFNTIFLQFVVHLLPCLHLQAADAVRIARLEMWRLQCNFSVERCCTVQHHSAPYDLYGVERHRTVLNGAVTVLYGACTVLNGLERRCTVLHAVHRSERKFVRFACTVLYGGSTVDR